jgi:hypothetical protein
MKTKTNIKIGFVWLGALLLVGVAQAATLVTYTATADPNLNPDGLADGVTSVDVWQMTLPGGPSSTGSFFNGPPDNEWASYSTTAATGVALAEHIFVGGALTAGQGIQIDFANQGITASRQVGIRLNSGATTVFTLFYEGGGPGFYQYTDSVTTGGNAGESYGFGTYFDFAFNLTSDTTYSATFGSGSFVGDIVSSPIDRIIVFNDAQNSAGAVFFRDLAVIPEPSSAALLLLSALGMAAIRRGKRRV